MNLHPLAIVSICECETRLRRGGTKLPTNAPLIGLLFGSVDKEGGVSITDGVEAIYDYLPTQDSVVLNLPKIAERKSLWCTVHPSYGKT